MLFMFLPEGTPCAYGELRLIGGTNELEGRLEVCIDGQFGSICDDFWSVADANTACLQMGFAGVGKHTQIIIITVH